MSWDFSETSDADLLTAKANALAKLNELLTGVQSGSLDGGSFREMSLGDLQEVQGAINAECRNRGVNDDIDDDFIAVEFEEVSE